jgi:mutator protein MutT
MTLPHKKIGVAVIRNNQGKILIDQRLSTGLMANLWEFPGGKIEPNETITNCIKREIKEELGIDIEVGENLITITHDYDQFTVTLIVHLCKIIQGEPQPLECQQVKWVEISDLDQFEFPRANIEIINALKIYYGIKV